MDTSSRRLRFAVASLLVLALSACAERVVSEPDVTDPEPEPVPALADGEWFALITVGEDETAAVTLGVDVAEMLSGDEARQAAIEDGFIAEDEDLPNDFYIRNPDEAMELLQFTDSPEITLISSQDTSQTITVTPDELAQVYEGTHPNGESFYVGVGQPIPMDVSVLDGLVVSVSQVYVP